MSKLTVNIEIASKSSPEVYEYKWFPAESCNCKILTLSYKGSFSRGKRRTRTMINRSV